MPERNEAPTALEMTSTAAPAPNGIHNAQSLAQALQSLPEAPLAEEEARNRIASLEREARASANQPSGAPLFYEMGLLWEDPVGNARNAAVAFQNAYKLAPQFLPNIRAARRLFADVGNWQMVVQLLDAELSTTQNLRHRISLLLEKATILEERLSRIEDASLTYRQCLDLEPSEIAILIELETVYSARQDFEALVRVYRLLAKNLEDTTLRAYYLGMAGLALEERMHRMEEAAACYREAFALERKDLSLLSAIKRIAERDGNAQELLEALAAEAEALGPQAAATHLQMSRVYEKLGRQEDALAALLAARRANPNEALILSELARIYESQARYEELANVLSSWASCIADQNELVAINLRLAALFEENLKRDQDAIERYQAILEKVPAHWEALASLGKLYFRTQNWAGLVSVFDAEVTHSEDPRQKVSRMYRAAEVAEEKVGDVEGAIARYNQCLQVQPGYLPAHKSLIRLFERLGRHGDLLATYEQDLLQTVDKDHTAATLSKMAVVYEEKLQDFDRAIDCLKRILEVIPDHLTAIRNLARLYERTQRFAELIQLHELEAGLVGDIKQVLALRHRNAELLEDPLKNRAGAIAEYERLLALSPSYLPALKNLGRLYAHDERWDDLIRMYRAEAEIATSPDLAAALIYKIGELYEHKLKNLDAAIASYQEVLTLSPRYFTALRALARIYRNQSAWESLIDVLRSEGANRTDPVERANALFQVAVIWENHLGRPDMATEGYQEVLRLTPDHTAAIRSLERLYTAQNNLKELVAVLDREAQTTSGIRARVAAQLKLARLYLERLNEPARAAQCCENALALEPDNVIALKLLERSRTNDPARRAEVRARLLQKATDAKLKTALEKATAFEEAKENSQAVLAVFKSAWREDPTDLRLSIALERALRQARDFESLVRFYEDRLSAATEAQERVELALRIADLCENKLEDPARAARYYQLALELSPGLVPALCGARRAYLRLEDYGQARRMLEMEAQTYKDSKTAQEALTAAGRLCAEKLNDTEGAIANFRRALERDPLDPEAAAGLQAVLSRSGGAAELAQMHELRGQAKLSLREVRSAAEEFYAAARIWLSQAHDSDRAMSSIERALAAEPAHLEALELKAQLALDNEQYSQAAAALSARVQQGGEAKKLAALHLQLGAVYQDRLGDLSRAAAHLQTAALSSPDSVEAYERLSAIHRGSRNWTGAADCLRRVLELEERPAELARHNIALATLMEEGFSDPVQAAELYRRALTLIPGDQAAIEHLTVLCEKTNNLADLVQTLEEQVAHAEANSDRARTLSLRLKIGELLARSPQEAKKAIASFRKAAELDPSAVAAHAGLAELYMRDAAAASMAIQEHLSVLRLDLSHVESLHALFRLWEGLRQFDKAFCAAGILHFLKSANEVESAFYAEALAKLPQETDQTLPPHDWNMLLHPLAQAPLRAVLEAIGDQLSKLYPPQLEALGIDRKQDRIKPAHSLGRTIHAIAAAMGVEELEMYQARRGAVVIETTEPLSVCVGPELARDHNVREQKFLLGKALLILRCKAAAIGKLSSGELADLLGNAIRIASPGFNGLGRRNETQAKQLRKVLSRKALRALEAACQALTQTREVSVEDLLRGLAFSADRSGLLFCADVATGLQVLTRGGGTVGSVDGDATKSPQARPEVKALVAFALSDEFFRLRQRLKMGITS